MAFDGWPHITKCLRIEVQGDTLVVDHIFHFFDYYTKGFSYRPSFFCILFSSFSGCFWIAGKVDKLLFLSHWLWKVICNELGAKRRWHLCHPKSNGWRKEKRRLPWLNSQSRIGRYIVWCNQLMKQTEVERLQTRQRGRGTGQLCLGQTCKVSGLIIARHIVTPMPHYTLQSQHCTLPGSFVDILSDRLRPSKITL